MTHENAKATILAATHCICCGRSLVDAVSVEMGIGPVCRGKYLPDDADVTHDQRKEANALVFKAACNDTSNADKLLIADQVEALGFPKFAEIVRKRFLKDSVRLEPKAITFGKGQYAKTLPAYVVNVPYNSKTKAFNAALKNAIDWRDRTPVWTVKNGKKVWGGWAIKGKSAVKAQLLEVLAKYFKGQAAIGPKGTFIIGQTA